MSIKNYFCKYSLVKIGLAVLLSFMLLMQCTGCIYIQVPDEPVPEYDISVTDKPYDFVNAENLPENDDTEYEYKPDMRFTSETRIFYGAGTCPFLEGKKIVALFFIDDDESKWSKRAIQNFTNKSVLPALDFVEKEANLFDVELDFEVWRFSSDFSEDLNLKYSGTVNPDLLNGATTKDLMLQTAQILGYSNDMALRWALMEKSGGIEIIPVFILNKEGVSYAQNTYMVSSVKYAEHAVVFSDNTNGLGERAYAVAHEILHLYGAEDLYMPEPRYNLALELYPYDIMLIKSKDFDKAKVDSFTAYTLGWKRKPKICNNPQWYTSDVYKQYNGW